MGWIIVGGMLFIAAFVYLAVQAVVLVARGVVFVAASALRLLAALLR